MKLIARVKKGRRYRRQILSVLLAVLAMAAMFTAATASEAQAATLLSQGQPRYGVFDGERDLPGVGGRGRQPGDEMVERVLRPAVAAG